MTKKRQKKVLKATTVDESEVGQFEILGDQWWDESGPMKPLHRLNPKRMEYIRDRIAGHYDRNPARIRALAGLTALDIGCGGGLVAEPMARMGMEMTAIDAGPENIKAAKKHAAENDIEIDYRTMTAEYLAANGQKFDVVTALEIVEHVADVGLFLKSCCALVKPGGLLIVSTLNRTPKSFLLGIVAAEYILRWLPAGTHNWKKFLRPSEIAKHLTDNGLKPVDVSGLVYNPITRAFSISRSDMDVNYFLTAVKN